MTVDSTRMLSDIGNAERFAEQWEEKLIFVPGIGWHVYDGKRWVEDKNCQVMELAKQTVKALLTEAAGTENDDKRVEIAKWALKSQERRHIEAIPRLACSDARFVVSVDKLDAQPFDFNVDNGTIDLRTGKMRPHDASDRITKLAPVRYDAKAKAPQFFNFVDRIFGKSTDLIDYVRRLLGMCLTGDASEQLLPIFWGEGANGKSTLLDIVRHVMGDYAGTAPDTLLTVSKRPEHPTELADLQGKRLVVASETEANARLRVQLVKKLTGETTLKARKMRKDFYEFHRTHKLVLQTNNKPVIREETEAVWRRILLVPFTTIIPKAERDQRLTEKLKAEASGVLAWLVYGCLDWQKHGLGAPAAVQAATQHYREESDPIAEFFDECCTIGENVEVKSGDLRAAYKQWCEDEGVPEIKGRAFTDRLIKLGATPQRKYAGRFWRGIGLVAAGAYEGEEVTT